LVLEVARGLWVGAGCGGAGDGEFGRVGHCVGSSERVGGVVAAIIVGAVSVC
jgi:hypothetical protein